MGGGYDNHKLRRSGIMWANQVDDFLRTVSALGPVLAGLLLVFMLSSCWNSPGTRFHLGKYYIFLGLIGGRHRLGQCVDDRARGLCVVMTAVLLLLLPIVKAMFLTEGE
jgi:hypothetical protein